MTNPLTESKTNTPVILQYLDKFQGQIAAALPKHMTSDRMARIVTTEIRKTPTLLECNPRSLFGAVIQASQLGLEPGSALGHAYLLPFRNSKQKTMDVQLIIGYRGMIDLARRSGQIVSITARAVHESDTFHYSFGLEDKLEHTPCTSGDCGKLTHVYAIAQLKGGGVQWEVMTLAEVEKVRTASKAGNNGPWKTHFEEMAKKTIIRRLFKYLPVSIEMQTAVGLDEQAEAGVLQQNEKIIDIEEDDFTTFDDLDEAPKKGLSAMKEKIKSPGEKGAACP